MEAKTNKQTRPNVSISIIPQGEAIQAAEARGVYIFPNRAEVNKSSQVIGHLRFQAGDIHDINYTDIKE